MGKAKSRPPASTLSGGVRRGSTFDWLFWGAVVAADLVTLWILRPRRQEWAGVKVTENPVKSGLPGAGGVPRSPMDIYLYGVASGQIYTTNWKLLADARKRWPDACKETH